MDELAQQIAPDLGYINLTQHGSEAMRRRESRYQAIAGGLMGAVERPSEARQALAYVLGSLDAGVSLEALERAIATIRTHLEATP